MKRILVDPEFEYYKQLFNSNCVPPSDEVWMLQFYVIDPDCLTIEFHYNRYDAKYPHKLVGQDKLVHKRSELC